MPGRIDPPAGAVNRYKYGFNGKENDNEVKGGGNSLDFGMRINDVRLGVWQSIDPYAKVYPGYSPYSSMGNNPIYFTDPTGGFLIDVHKRISNNALNKTVAKSSDVLMYRNRITGQMQNNYDGSVVAPDKRSLPKPLGGGLPSDNHDHFDNMNFTQIIANFASKSIEVNDVLNDYKQHKITAYQVGGRIGEVFHAIQDFYSHSNYIELYLIWNNNVQVTDLTAIPTFEEAMSLSKYKSFSVFLRNNLKTGVYNEDDPQTGPDSHKMMNHDLGAGSKYEGSPFVKEVKGKKVTWNSRAAEAVAQKATEILNAKIEKELK